MFSYKQKILYATTLPSSVPITSSVYPSMTRNVTSSCRIEPPHPSGTACCLDRWPTSVLYIEEGSVRALSKVVIVRSLPCQCSYKHRGELFPRLKLGKAQIAGAKVYTSDPHSSIGISFASHCFLSFVGFYLINTEWRQRVKPGSVQHVQEGQNRSFNWAFFQLFFLYLGANSKIL